MASPSSSDRPTSSESPPEHTGADDAASSGDASADAGSPEPVPAEQAVKELAPEHQPSPRAQPNHNVEVLQGADQRTLLQRLMAFETVLVAAGFILFFIMLYEMEVPPVEGSFLNPPLVAIAGAIMLWPVRKQRAVQALLLAGGVLLLLWFVDKVSAILVPFLGVYLLAYLLNPVVRRLHLLYRVPRWASSLVVTLLVVGLFFLFILILGPNIAGQVENLSTRIIGAVDQLRTWLATSTLLDRLETAGIIEKQEALRQITELIQRQADQLPQGVERVARSVGSLLGLATLLALVPVLLFYTLRDYTTIRDAVIGLFPTSGGRRDYLVDASSIVGGYLRGQFIISAIAAFNVSVALLVFKVPFGLLIGIIAGILNFIPNLGAIITLAIGVTIAFIFGGLIKAFIVVIVLTGQALLEQSILTPNILSYQVGLHPVLVLLSLLVFGSFMGIFGLLIAVPATAILATAYKAYREELTFELNEYGADPNGASPPDGM